MYLQSFNRANRRLIKLLTPEQGAVEHQRRETVSCMELKRSSWRYADNKLKHKVERLVQHQEWVVRRHFRARGATEQQGYFPGGGVRGRRGCRKLFGH